MYPLPETRKPCQQRQNQEPKPKGTHFAPQGNAEQRQRPRQSQMQSRVSSLSSTLNIQSSGLNRSKAMRISRQEPVSGLPSRAIPGPRGIRFLQQGRASLINVTGEKIEFPTIVSQPLVRLVQVLARGRPSPDSSGWRSFLSSSGESASGLSLDVISVGGMGRGNRRSAGPRTQQA